MESIYPLVVANKICLTWGSVSTHAVWRISIYLHLSAPVLSSSTWWKTTGTPAGGTSGRHMVHVAINHRHEKTVISAISWGPQACEQMLALYISFNVCGHHHSFSLSHLLPFLCQNIPGKLFKTMWPSRWNSFWKPNELKLNQKDEMWICAKTLNLSL